MKKQFSLFLLIIPFFVFAQQTSKTMTHDGQSRKYIEYIPSTYNANTAIPVVFSLHGLGDNMNNFCQIGFHQLADTAKFIVITPEALLDNFLGGNAWNCGASMMGISANPSVDDIGFIGAILDQLIIDYNIDETRVYCCGFSLGGFMTNKIACELNDRFTAIASVAGTIGTGLNCTPGKAVPVCHFHGTNDATIGYTGNAYGMDAEDLVDFWVSNNSCNSGSDSTQLPDLATDGYSVTHYEYSSCDNNKGIEFFKVIGATHEWLWRPSNDISYTEEIWKFFLKHPGFGANIKESALLSDFNIYPNPSSGTINVHFENFNSNLNISILGIDGRSIMGFKPNKRDLRLDLSKFDKGPYIVRLNSAKNTQFEIIFLN